MKPRSEGGDNKLGNLRLVHAECHRSIHSRYHRKEMADLVDKSIDYVRFDKEIIDFDRQVGNDVV